MEGAERVFHTKKRATPTGGPQHLIGCYVTDCLSGVSPNPPHSRRNQNLISAEPALRT